MLERYVRGEERDEGSLSIKPEGIVGQIDGVEGWQGEKSSQEGG